MFMVVVDEAARVPEGDAIEPELPVQDERTEPVISAGELRSALHVLFYRAEMVVQMPEQAEIKVNRAPVLTLWAAVVAERLGHDPDAAITLGRAVAGSSARIKARAIGLDEGKREEAPGGKAKPHPPAPRQVVHLLGRDVPVIEGKEGVRALDGDKAAAAGPARAYVERALGEHLPAVRQAMEALAGSVEPAELNRTGFRLYEHFRPEVPPGTKGWGAKGVLDVARIKAAAG